MLQSSSAEAICNPENYRNGIGELQKMKFILQSLVQYFDKIYFEHNTIHFDSICYANIHVRSFELNNDYLIFYFSFSFIYFIFYQFTNYFHGI